MVAGCNTPAAGSDERDFIALILINSIKHNKIINNIDMDLDNYDNYAILIRDC